MHHDLQRGLAAPLLRACPFAAHKQIERIALTEPTEVELPEVLRGLLRAVPTALRGLARYVSGLGSEAGGRVQSAEEAARRRPDR